MTRHILLVAVLSLSGCSWFGGSSEEADNAERKARINDDTSTREIAAIAKAFKKGNDEGKAALEAAEMTPADFDKALYNIAMSPKASETYVKVLSR